ncbi:uncharacterized protein [Aristolochia californica]|uniref:uncharacterized protein n=1 Tax=Aristolochia californica TaxID=171875 RepID=UPI0035E1B426
MNQIVFHKLAEILYSKVFLSPTKTVSVEEQLTYFLLIVGQQQSYSVTTEIMHSLEGFKQSNVLSVFETNIPLEEQQRFWNRKNYLSQNVMATCTFEMQFTYVLTGWEGSADDSCVLKDVLTRQDRIIVPKEDDNSDEEFGGGGDEVRLAGVNEDEDSDNLVDEDNLSTNMWRQHALESTRATQFRDVIPTNMWSDHLWLYLIVYEHSISSMFF